MSATDNIRDIFSILHDGTISGWTGDRNLLTLKIDCQYLAERIDKSFKAEQEILSAEIKENLVVVSCNQYDTDFSYCGGNLTINCMAIKISDQNRNELTIDEIDIICKSYWTEMSKELEKSIIASHTKR